MANKNEKSKKGTTKKSKKKKKAPKVSYYRKPADMTLSEWQKALRIQFGKQAEFKITNLGEHPVFSDFQLNNKESGSTHRVALRTKEGVGNFCTCLDFKTNRLGTCKHIAFVCEKIGNKRGHKRIFKAGYQQPHSSIYLEYGTTRKIKLSIGTEEAAAFQKWSKNHFESDGILKQEGFSKFEKIISEARAIHPQFRCYDDALNFVIGYREMMERNAKIDQLLTNGLESPFFKKILKTELYDYQKQGVLAAVRAGRSLNADEMGLGKTIQGIAVAEFYKKYFNINRVLIISPTSLKYQWKSEIEKFTNSKAEVIEGSALKRWKMYENIEAPMYQISSYHAVKYDLKNINMADFDLLILDEAQRIKNWKTKTSASIKKIQSNYALVLTGTPIENKLEELYSIMQVIDQFRLPPLYEFLDRYTIKDPESERIIGYQHLKEIKENLSDILIRRTKKQVLKQMPRRSDKILLVPMTEEQMLAHEDFKAGVSQLVHKWRRMGFLKEKDRLRLMMFMSKMRMVCDSTFLVDKVTRHDTKILELFCLLENFFTSNPEAKVVIFSQWKIMCDLVAEELNSREIGFEFLNGSVPSKKRGGLLERFKNNPDTHVFLSTDAGGVGLNLQAASLVVNLDIPWNPAVLEQRIARVYRMGQETPVQVVNMVSAGTIEHSMLERLDFKASIAKGVLDDGSDAIFMHESKFKNFMGKIEDLTGGAPVSDVTTDGGTVKEEHEDLTNIPSESKKPKSDKPEENIPEELQEEKVETGKIVSMRPQRQGQASGHTSTNSPEELVQTGMNFLSGLVQTLSSPEKTKTLVKSITAKDEKTGQTYLKIPVENEDTVGQIFEVLGGLLKSFGK